MDLEAQEDNSNLCIYCGRVKCLSSCEYLTELENEKLIDELNEKIINEIQEPNMLKVKIEKVVPLDYANEFEIHFSDGKVLAMPRKKWKAIIDYNEDWFNKKQKEEPEDKVEGRANIDIDKGTITHCYYDDVVPRKDDSRKVQWHLLPFKYLESVARIFQFGAKKYSPKNYLGLKKSRIEDALMRHLYSYLMGERRDAETGESHLAHIICNCLMLMEKQND